jgi:hypothetical protein
VRWLSLKDQEKGPAGSLAFVDGEKIWVTRPILRRIDVAQPHVSAFKSVLTWDHEAEVVDLAYDLYNKRMYILDIKNNRIYIWDRANTVLEPSSIASLTSLPFHTVENFLLTATSRLVVWSETDSGIPIAILSGAEPDKLFLKPMDLNKEGYLVTLRDYHKVALTDEPVSWALAVDPSKGTAVLAGRHIKGIFECDLVSGKLTLLKAIEYSGRRKKESYLLPNGFVVSDILMFHYSDYFDESMLDKASVDSFNSAKNQGNDRCILIADQSNSMIYKLVEFGDLQCALPFLGNTIIRKGPFPITPSKNLLDIPIAFPSRLVLSPIGVLAVLSKLNEAILLLWPASAKSKDRHSKKADS